MMTKRENQQIEMHLITIEDLVPMDHLLRKVNDIIDFSFIYNEVENMYCHNNGRPSIDPVVLIKFLLIGFLYGINSERRILQQGQFTENPFFHSGKGESGALPLLLCAVRVPQIVRQPQ